MIKSYKYLICISFSLLLILGLIQKNTFVKREILYWDSDQKLNWNNFRGYPVYLTQFDALIHCYFDYDFENEDVESIRVRAFMLPHHSWVTRNCKESSEALVHEQYHFNISEIIARKFRKILSELPANLLNNESIKLIYKQHLHAMETIQMQYDAESDHSLIIERQKDWEYIIDSILIELGSYKFSYPLRKPEIQNTGYFRKVSVNAYNQIIGRFPIDSVTAKKTRHYNLKFSHDNNVKVEYRNRNKLENDDFFGAAIVVISTIGNRTDWRFFNRDHTRGENLNGVHVKRFLQSNGTLIKTNFDHIDNEIENNEGIHKIVWTLDSMQRKHIGRQYNINGDQVMDKKGFFIIHNSYDLNDNIIFQGNYNDGNELINLPCGTSFFKYEYDRSGNLTDFYSFNNNHLLHSFERNFASGHFKYDLDGNITRKHFKDVDGRIAFNETGAAISYYGFDAYANLIDERHFGLNKNLIIMAYNTGRLVYEYDSSGLLISVKNLDAYDRLLNDLDSVSSTSFYYNESNFVGKKIQYYSDSLYTPKHFRTILYGYDGLGNIIEESYFNENSEPKADTNGVSIIKYLYDDKNNLIQADHFNTSGKKQPNSQGVVSFRYKYDSRNNKTEAAYYNENGYLIETTEIAIDRYFYNSKNQLIERRFYNARNELTKNSSGVNIIQWAYDERGNIISETYFDENGELAANMNGVAKYSYFYNNRNLKTEILCYNKNNQLAANENDGVARIKFEFSYKNNHVKTSYFDKDNFLINLPEGYSIVEFLYDPFDNHVKTMYYSKNMELNAGPLGFASIEWIIDRNRNVVAEIYRDEYGSFVEDKDGFAIYNWIHDRNGEVIWSNGFDANRSSLPDINLGDFMVTTRGFNPMRSYSVKSDRNSRYQLSFYDNGQKESEVLYKDGKPDGIYKSWYESGELQSLIEYNSGLRDGKYIEYYQNGNRLREVNYIKNTFDHSSEVTWYETGNIKSMYVNDTRVEWDINGNIISD